ncbi:hypothetical protein HMPREF0880_03048 [Yokenella regensburgei ATCC 43003]|nr:hypothetical protein HMPREF0880_03048 [Yokenella regensburgei ATCC 43003]
MREVRYQPPDPYLKMNQIQNVTGYITGMTRQDRPFVYGNKRRLA